MLAHCSPVTVQVYGCVLIYEHNARIAVQIGCNQAEEAPTHLPHYKVLHEMSVKCGFGWENAGERPKAMAFNHRSYVESDSESRRDSHYGKKKSGKAHSVKS